MTQNKEYSINLEDYRVIGQDGNIAKVFTGRDRGEQVRIKSKLDEKEAQYDTIEIVIPDNIYSINPSFFEELFINVVMKLGKAEFLKKFNFKSLGNYNYNRPLTEAITRILRNKTAIG